jgi:hypothetical protein
MAEWVEVWGRETPTAARERLYKFPVTLWTDDFRDGLFLALDCQGVTDVEARRVRDDGGKAGGAAMTPVWLHDADGRQLFYVYVLTPPPPVVTYASRMFRWESARQRYEEIAPPVPCFLVGPEGSAEK